MKQTRYTRISMEGFQSIGKPLVFQLDNLGLNLIKGPNGRGKSTVFNGILWAEYGGNMKKTIATWEDRRPDTFRGTRVVIERTDGEFDYMTARHLGFKGTTKGLTGGDKLMLFKKPHGDEPFTQEHLIGQGLHKEDMQEIIREQLGMDSKTFLNAILFGQRMASFVDTKGDEKRQLFEQLFDVEFVEMAKTVAKTEETNLTTEIATLTTKFEGYETTVTNKEAKLQSDEKILKDFASKKKERIAAAKKELDETEAKKKVVDGEVDTLTKEVATYDLKKLDELNTKIAEDKPKLTLLEADEKTKKKTVDEVNEEITKAEGKKKKFEQDLVDVKTECPSCSEKIKPEKLKGVKDNIKAQIAAEDKVIEAQNVKLKPAQTAYDKAVADTKEVRERIDKNEIDAKKYSGDSTKKATAETNLKNKTERQTELLEEVTKAKTKWEEEKKAKEPELDLDKLRTEIQTAKDEKDKVDEQLKTKEARLVKVKWWITKGFGASGLKAFVFNAMLAQLNVFSQRYSESLGFRVEFSIDTTKASRPFQTLIYEQEYVRDYGDLSGGQKQRVDVVIAFAMHDLVSIGTNINILILDEIFEGLDAEGIEVAFSLIQEKSAHKSVYLITHVDMIDALNARSVTFDYDELKNTYIKN